MRRNVYVTIRKPNPTQLGGGAGAHPQRVVLQLVARGYTFDADRDVRLAQETVARLEHVLARGRVGIGARRAPPLCHATRALRWPDVGGPRAPLGTAGCEKIARKPEDCEIARSRNPRGSRLPIRMPAPARTRMPAPGATTSYMMFITEA